MRMAACFKPMNVSNSSSIRDIGENRSFHYIEELNFSCNINNDKLLDIIRFTFTKKGEYSAFGFNNKNKEFWAKKIIKEKCLLHFTLNVNFIDLEISNIVITPLVANEKELSSLLISISNILCLHQK
jgi:hypothetical protein